MIQNVFLEIPTWVVKGLADGTLSRNAAGVVRATNHHPINQGGAILGHLREVNGPSVNHAPSLLMPGLAIVAMQAASLAYLKVRLDRLDDKINMVQQQGREILSSLSHVQGLQYLDFTRPATESLELLARYQHGKRQRLLEDAHSGFIRATGGLRHLFDSHGADGLLDHATPVDGMLRASSLCAAGEIYCLGALGAPLDERCGALSQHESLWEGFDHTLNSAKPTSLRFPTLDSLRSSPDGNPNKTLRRWKEGAKDSIATYQGERGVITGLSRLDTKETEPWIEAANSGEHTVLFLQTA